MVTRKIQKDEYRRIPKAAMSRTDGVSLKFRRVLREHIQLFATEILSASNLNLAFDAHAEALQVSLDSLKDEQGSRMAVAGYKLTRGILQGKRALLIHSGALGKAPPPQEALDITAEAFGSDELIANHLSDHIAQWINKTSKWETRTSSKMFESLYNESFRFLEGEGYGLTPAKIRQEIIDRGLAASKQRANLMGRTIVNWGYNEGSISVYEDSGIQEVEWLAVVDAVTGEWDQELDGTRIPIRSNFVKANETFLTSEGSELSVPFDVPHPPLHPHCRCTIVPVF